MENVYAGTTRDNNIISLEMCLNGDGVFVLDDFISLSREYNMKQKKTNTKY